MEPDMRTYAHACCHVEWKLTSSQIQAPMHLHCCRICIFLEPQKPVKWLRWIKAWRYSIMFFKGPLTSRHCKFWLHIGNSKALCWGSILLKVIFPLFCCWRRRNNWTALLPCQQPLSREEISICASASKWCSFSVFSYVMDRAHCTVNIRWLTKVTCFGRSHYKQCISHQGHSACDLDSRLKHDLFEREGLWPSVSNFDHFASRCRFILRRHDCHHVICTPW